MTITEAAEYLRVPVATMRFWRFQGDQGPKSATVGKRVMYRRADVEQWLTDQFETA